MAEVEELLNAGHLPTCTVFVGEACDCGMPNRPKEGAEPIPEEERVYTTASGKVLTDDDIQALADEAEEGYDVEHLKVSPNAPPDPGLHMERIAVALERIADSLEKT